MTFDPRFKDTGTLIQYAMSRFRAERRERFVHAGGRPMRTHGPGERVIHLPNGDVVKVAVDDSGVATQVEGDENLHAIVRPHPIRTRFGPIPASASASHRARPRSLKTSLIPRRIA